RCAHPEQRRLGLGESGLPDRLRPLRRPVRRGRVPPAPAACQTAAMASTEATGSTEPRVLLLDTASLYFRAFFGVPDSLRAPDGTPVNAVRGLLDFIARLVTDYSPSHLVCCWDNDWRPAWRVELVPTYKEHRLAVDAGGAPVDREE